MTGPVYIAGPTACGKSAVALLLAGKLGGEIISVDSMQVYRGMEIGTAKPTLDERRLVPHHLLDVAEPHEPFDVAKFILLAREAERDIRQRGRIPIYCGGTGLYFKGLAAGIGQSPPADPKLREMLEAEPLPVLLEELEARDPATFARIDRSNPRRVIRAVEVIRLTGRPYSELRAEWNPRPFAGAWFGLERQRADLVARINQRVERMFAAGLVQETRELLERGLERNRAAMQALGYRQVVEYLRGERGLDATIELVKLKTRQYAKRQMTWFRRQLPLRWIEIGPETEPAATAEAISKICAQGQF